MPNDSDFRPTRPDKVLYPDAGLTKQDLADYYAAVAQPLLAHARGRPLTLRRFPDGIAKDGFFQQHHRDDLPESLVPLPAPRARGDGEMNHISVDTAEGLAALANLAVLEMHAWLARADSLGQPDRLIFDLDPADGDFGAVRTGARRVAELMDDLGLTPHLMTTGSRGLHVVAPLQPRLGFDTVRDLAQAMARRLAEHHPDSLTTAQRKDQRGGKLYLDVMRNAYGQTAVLPYSPRARPGAPVAAPLTWEELDDLDAAAAHGIRDMPQRLAELGDPWAELDAAAADPRGLQEALDAG
jgi:bifunctional non-homologous end joining protein LigD